MKAVPELDRVGDEDVEWLSMDAATDDELAVFDPAKKKTGSKIPQVHLHGLKVVDVEFKESEHPRAPDGKFGQGGGSSSSTGGGGSSTPAKTGELTDKNGDKYQVKRELVDERPVYTVTSGDKVVAKATMPVPGSYTEETHGAHVGDIEVAKELQRRGIASALYDYIEGDVGKKLGQSPGWKSAATKGLWEKRSATAALDLATMKKVGAKPGGSVPGAIYRDASGADWLVKKTSSEDLSRNEVLAGSLYKAAGVAVPELKLVKDGGKQYVGSKMVAGYKPAGSVLSSGALPGVGEGFAADAWLANWDAAGLVYDNIGTVEGKPMRIDVGGALAYRGMGQPKGDKFGPKVGEIETMRDPKINPQNAKAFGKVTPADIKAGVAKIAAIPDDKVRAMVSELGPRDAAANKRLADTLIARKADLVKRFGT